MDCGIADKPSPRPPARPAVSTARMAAAFAALTALACGLLDPDWLMRLLTVSSHPPHSPLEKLWEAAQYGIFLGGFLGVAQWCVLRRWMRLRLAGEAEGLRDRHVRDAGWWVVFTLAGTLSGALLASGLEIAVGPSLTPGVCSSTLSLMQSVIRGALLGTAQWALLRRHGTRTGWWILLSAIGVAIRHEWSGWQPDVQIDPQNTLGAFLLVLALFTLEGLPLGLLQGIGLTLIAPLRAEQPDTKARSRGWPEDRGARLLVAVGLVTFALGLFAAYSFELDSPSGIQALLAYADLAPPYSLLPVLGLLLIPLSVLVAAARHAWAAVTAGIGTGFALLPFLDFLSHPAMLRIPRAPICWLTAGLLLTVGWIVAGRRPCASGQTTPDPTNVEPPTSDTP